MIVRILLFVSLLTTPALTQTLSIPNAPTVTIDATAAPDLQPWISARVAPMMQTWYPQLLTLLPGGDPPKKVTLVFSAAMPNGVANTAHNRISASTDWFRAHPDDVGALFHEMVHTVQQSVGYGDPHHPVWLIEGIADELRFYVYEPAVAAPPDGSPAQPGAQPHGANIPPRRAPQVHYNDSYRTTGNFLHFVATSLDPRLIAQLTEALRTPHGADDSTWLKLTGHPLSELDQAWHASLLEQTTPRP